MKKDLYCLQYKRNFVVQKALYFATIDLNMIIFAFSAKY